MVWTGKVLSSFLFRLYTRSQAILVDGFCVSRWRKAAEYAGKGWKAGSNWLHFWELSTASFFSRLDNCVDFSNSFKSLCMFLQYSCLPLACTLWGVTDVRARHIFTAPLASHLYHLFHSDSFLAILSTTRAGGFSFGCSHMPTFWLTGLVVRRNRTEICVKCQLALGKLLTHWRWWKIPRWAHQEPLSCSKMP